MNIGPLPRFETALLNPKPVKDQEWAERHRCGTQAAGAPGTRQAVRATSTQRAWGFDGNPTPQTLKSMHPETPKPRNPETLLSGPRVPSGCAQRAACAQLACSPAVLKANP